MFLDHLVGGLWQVALACDFLLGADPLRAFLDHVLLPPRPSSQAERHQPVRGNDTKHTEGEQVKREDEDIIC